MGGQPSTPGEEEERRRGAAACRAESRRAAAFAPVEPRCVGSCNSKTGAALSNPVFLLVDDGSVELDDVKCLKLSHGIRHESWPVAARHKETGTPRPCSSRQATPLLLTHRNCL